VVLTPIEAERSEVNVGIDVSIREQKSPHIGKLYTVSWTISDTRNLQSEIQFVSDSIEISIDVFFKNGQLVMPFNIFGT